MVMQTNRTKLNDVNGWSAPGRPDSSGRDCHATQVTPDRQQATAIKLKNNLKIGTWNVRTMFQKGKLDNIKQEMERLKINILGISEVRWKDAGLVDSDQHKLIYSGGSNHEKGVGVILDKGAAKSLKGNWPVSDRVLLIKLEGKPLNINIIQVYAPTSASTDEDIDVFYEDLEKAKNQCKSQDPIIIMGDFNAKVGSERVDDVVGPFGLGEKNERGERLTEWAQINNFIIGNTWFEQPLRRRWTWKSPGDGSRNQIDYILIPKRFRNALLTSKTLPGADCYSDHVPVIGNFRLKLQKRKSLASNKKLNLALLKSDSDIREKFRVKVQNKFAVLELVDEVEQQWEQLRDSITEAACEEIPEIERKAKQKWMTDDILDLMDERRRAKGNQEEYKRLHREVRRKCNEAKEAWLDEKCREIDLLQRFTPQIMYQNVAEIAGRKTCSSTGCLKSKNGEIIMEKDKILERWAEYTKELYDDDRRDINVVKNNFAGPPIMKDEVRAAIRKMKKGKAMGPDSVAIEEVEALGEFGIEKLTHLLNEIYDTGEIPTEMSKSIFIALPKKPGAIECELHRTISLMSHVTKVLLRIIMMRVRSKIRPEISEEQCGFVEGKGTANAVYMLRTIIERALEVQKDVYLCFIDYTKAFDKVKHDELLKLLNQLHVDGKDLRIIKNMYWDQTAAVRVENDTSPFQKIKRGVRQGCVLSPDLFNLYSELIMRNLEDSPGIKVGGKNVNNLRYADDTVLIAENEKDLQNLLDIVERESAKKGLELNGKKTEVMVVSRKSNITCNLYTKGTKLKQRETFKYLGTLITQDGRNGVEVSSRIAQAKTTFQRLRPFLANNNISLTTREKALQCYIEPILMYGCEAWTINKQTQRKLEAAEMWFLRRMLRIPWTAKKSNETVLKEAETERSLIMKIRKRQATFFGHIMRGGGLEHFITTGKLDGKRGKGRQREKMLDGLKSWLGVERVTDMMSATKDRDVWRNMIANAMRTGT